MRRRRSRSVSTSVTVDIDLDDVLDQLDDDDIKQLFTDRKLGPPDGFFDRDYAYRAFEELMGGRPAAALALLDRALFPTDANGDDLRRKAAA